MLITNLSRYESGNNVILTAFVNNGLENSSHNQQEKIFQLVLRPLSLSFLIELFHYYALIGILRI